MGILGILFLGIIALAAILGSLMLFGVINVDREKAVDTPTDSAGNPVAVGVNVESLAALQVNAYSDATEGGNDLEFWDLGADVSDTSKSPREVLTLASGSVTDTSVPSLRSGDSQVTKDLWVEGNQTYYDQKIVDWEIQYNEQTGKGVLQMNGPSGSANAVAFGSFADMDTATAVDTGFIQAGAGTINYSLAAGDGTAYIRLTLGNDASNSELKGVVFCIGDADGDLEGNEVSAISINRYSGSSIGTVPSNALALFSGAAGTSSTKCQSVGDIVNDGGLTKGEYQIDFTIVEANFASGEEWEIAMDDLGSYKARQYPSGHLKATTEDVVVQYMT